MNQSSEVLNTSGLRPLGRAVLVKPYEPEKKKSLIAIPDAVQERMTMVDDRVVVIECGPACWPDEPARAKPGDKVLIAKYSGHMSKGTADGLQYRVVNDRDIFLQIVEEGVL